MIDYIKGTLEELTPTDAVVETAGGIGYILSISLNTFTPLQGVREAKLFVHEIIREDEHLLFGFIEREERELFRLLLSVSGVGANTARMILSSLTPSELRRVIASGDARRLKAVKGIGSKTAERIIVDLKDKIKEPVEALAAAVANTSEIFEEALAAMVMLGFPKAAAQKSLTKIFESTPSISVESAIKKALSMM